MTGFLLYDKIGINRNSWFASALCQYAKKQGVDLKLIVREDLQLQLKDSCFTLKYQNASLELPGFVINRCIDPFAAECFELAGVKVFNSAKVCRICNDKRLTHVYFSGQGIKMADSVFLDKNYNSVNSEFYPAVIKSAVGHGGSEVFMANDPGSELQALNAIESSKYLIQKPVKTPGRDLRVYVMGGKILCSVLRSCDTDFRSNFSLGGKAELYNMTNEQQQLVYKILSILPVTFAGIDFIFDGEQTLLNEVEDIVGSRMIYTLTDIPVHKLLIDTVLKSL